MAARMLKQSAACAFHDAQESAGVPIKKEVVGVAMGLILTEDGRYKILTDILGSEDALGDMDFKVAGDDEHITAFQMDIKVGLEYIRGKHALHKFHN